MGALASFLGAISSTGWCLNRSDSQLYQNLSASPQNDLVRVQNTQHPCVELRHVCAPQITNVAAFVVPLGNADNVDACTYLSENWALLAWVGCTGSADASLQLSLSRPGPTTVGHLCH